jgi:hypothetical protein
VLTEELALMESMLIPALVLKITRVNPAVTKILMIPVFPILAKSEIFA